MSLSAAIGNASPHRANDRGPIAGSCKQVTELTSVSDRSWFEDRLPASSCRGQRCDQNAVNADHAEAATTNIPDASVKMSVHLPQMGEQGGFSYA
jgi:hypothetical protein